MGRLDDKVAVITGGASGIGRATVRLFVNEGARVVFGDIEDGMAQTLASELGPNASFLHTDVTREEDIRALVDHAVERLGRLDCMFNNAGSGGASGPIDEISTEDWDATVALLLRSVFLGIKHAARVMRPRGAGSIVSTSSVAGIQTGFGAHPYSTCKAGIIHLTRTAAMELGLSGIRVNCVCPGGIATGIFGRGLGLCAEDALKAAELLKVPFADLQPIRRAGLPEDIAQAALWLASDDSAFVNGHALVVDGGLTGGHPWTGADPEASPIISAIVKAFQPHLEGLQQQTGPVTED